MEYVSYWRTCPVGVHVLLEESGCVWWMSSYALGLTTPVL